MPDQDTDALDEAGCLRLVAAVLRSALDGPPRIAEQYVASADFVWWCEVGGADPAWVRARWRQQVTRGPK